MDKSELILIKREDKFDALTLKSGCKLSNLPSSHFGLPLGGPFRFMAIWDSVKERSCKRLVMWKRQFSKGSRVTLIHYSLQHAYLFSISLLHALSS